MRKTALVPLKSTRKPPSAPRHLEAPERNLWAKIVAEHQFDDAASQAILRTALEAHQRMRRCRELVDDAGETVLDRFNQVKPHPLLPTERDARAAFLQAMRALNLDVSEA
jgi:P27 family predicted phage terminase small subunit